MYPRLAIAGGLFARRRSAFSFAAALAQLRSRGDTLAMPGIGTVNGFATSNYLESLGPTIAALDGPAGLALDAGRAADVPQALSAWGGTSVTLSVVDGWQRGTSTGSPCWINLSFPSVVGETYRITGLLRFSAGQWRYMVGTSAGGNQIFAGVTGANIDVFVTAISTLTYISLRSLTITIGDYVEASGLLAARIPGIHFRQATTANKPLLRQLGGAYRWEFDGTDTLAATIPSGYESCTIIDAAPGGQVTLTGQNIVGTYSIGPSITTHGRIIARNALTGAELALYQQLANKLAGL